MVFSSKTLTVSVFTKENKWTPRKLSGKYREMRKGRGKGEGGYCRCKIDLLVSCGGCCSVII